MAPAPASSSPTPPSPGTANAVQSFVTGQAGLSLAACTDFKGSDGIPQLNAAKITATVPSGGTATNNVTRFLISVPAAGDSASGTTNWNLAEVNSAGTIAKFEVYLNASGTLLVQLRNSGGTVHRVRDHHDERQGQAGPRVVRAHPVRRQRGVRVQDHRARRQRRSPSR